MSLYGVDYSTGAMDYPHRRRQAGEEELQRHLAEAAAILETLTSGPRPEPFGLPDVSADFEALRWFPLPDEISPEAPVTA